MNADLARVSGLVEQFETDFKSDKAAFFGAILGLKPPYFRKDVRLQFKKLSRSCHPDKNPDFPKKAEEAQTLLSMAQEHLTRLGGSHTVLIKRSDNLEGSMGYISHKRVPGVNEQVFHCWADDAQDCNRSLDLQEGDRLLSFQDLKVKDSEGEFVEVMVFRPTAPCWYSEQQQTFVDVYGVAYAFLTHRKQEEIKHFILKEQESLMCVGRFMCPEEEDPEQGPILRSPEGKTLELSVEGSTHRMVVRGPEGLEELVIARTTSGLPPTFTAARSALTE